MANQGYLILSVVRAPGMGGRKSGVYAVKGVRTHETLGEIRWYAPWRQYAFYPVPGTLYNHECLRWVQAQLVTLTCEQRQRARAAREART